MSNKKVFATIGASNHTSEIRANYDYYATDPRAVLELLKKEVFSHEIWEPACGEGHISKELSKVGYNVRTSDIVNRGLPNTEVLDFLQTKENKNYDIITNPPYCMALEFVQHALDISTEGTKIAMLLRLTFLEGQKRGIFFKKYPPKTVYVFSSRVICAKNGDFDKIKSSAIAYAWFIWEKGVTQEPIIKWI